MIDDFENLKQLFGGYLHQDWPDEFGSDAEAVQAMIEGDTPDTIAAAREELRELLSMQISEQELANIMVNRLGCYFEPASVGKTYREWLKGVVEQWARAK